MGHSSYFGKKDGSEWAGEQLEVSSWFSGQGWGGLSNYKQESLKAELRCQFLSRKVIHLQQDY